MSADDMDEYLTEIERLKQKYATQIELYVGLEIDYLDESYNAAIPYFRQLPLDYRIGSIHFLPWQLPLIEGNMVCIDGSYDEFAAAIETHYENDIRGLITDFFDSAMRMITIGGFDIVGHFDKIHMNGSKHPDFKQNTPSYTQQVNACLDLIAEKGLIVEINTKNLLRKQQTYPHKAHFKALFDRRIPVMVNSDCHFPDLVNSGRSETLELLKSVGYRTTRELVRGQWDDVAID